MPIDPISAGIAPIVAPAPIAGTTGVSAAAKSDFGQAIAGSIEQLQQSQTAVDEMSKAAATGDLASVENHMIAMTEAQLATQLTVAVRNKAIEAFNDIMRMQL
ncbi:MAG: flagellar hook-basal body complex protein FliE [Acidimicrobiia bacterium]|nr:flagellar hook-basal body complex protein FliE [Acidimicrobiia bacterium]